MNEKELRAKMVETADSYYGAKQGSAKHKKIVNTFNTLQPDGWAMTYDAPWCATFASAIAILVIGKDLAKKYFPLSANCGTIITKAKSLKIWKESDSYVPKAGDWILYDWDDSGKGDNKNGPDHVGIVKAATKKEILVIEGNKNKAVGERKVPINGRYIRGFVIPDYKAAAKAVTLSKRPTGKEMVDLARKQLGKGYKKFCAAYGKATSWCEIFIWWLFTTKNMPIKKTSFARRAAKWFAEHYEHISMKDAKAGDVVFFTSKAKGRNKMIGMVTHVGLIRKKGTSTICYTIEGNVNGDGNWKKSEVAEKTRGLNYVWGIFRPKYREK
jgi:hypothetical protein